MGAEQGYGTYPHRGLKLRFTRTFFYRTVYIMHSLVYFVFLAPVRGRLHEQPSCGIRKALMYL